MSAELQELISFHLTGKRDTTQATGLTDADLVPAVLAPYRDLSRLRYDYPLILVDGAETPAFVDTLSGVINRLLRAIAPEGNAGEQLRQHVLRLERRMRELATEKPGQHLSDLWKRAEKSLLAEGEAGESEWFGNSIATARFALQVDGEVVDCDEQLPERLMVHAWRRFAGSRHDTAVTIDDVIIRLRNVLKVDDLKNSASRTPQRLKATLGKRYKEAFDFERMAELLEDSTPHNRLPAARRFIAEQGLNEVFGGDLSEVGLIVQGGLYNNLQRALQTLGLADAYDALDTKAFTPVTDQMRTIAYTMCQNDGWHYPISRVTPTGFFARRDIVGTTPPRAGHISPAPSQYGNISESNIFEDIQYCATKLEIVSVVASDAPLDTVEIGSDGAPGQKTDQGTLNVPTRGEISVGGKMGAFTCWNDLDGDTELAFVINGTDVLTLRRPVGATDYLNAGNETIDIAQAALAAGITPKEGSSHDLKIIRRRTRCDQRLWGDADYQIGKATINWKNPTMKTEVTLEDTLQARSSASVSVRVKVIDQLGQDGFFDGINVVLNVSGGVAALVSGTTDAQGYFRTSVTPNNPNLAILGDAPAQNLTITAVATSFEGVTAQDVGTALVLPCDSTDYGFREGGTGQKTLQFGYLKASGQASAGNYVYATTEWDDDYAIYPNDTSLNGQRGYVYIKVHYKFTSTGFSDSRPAARVVIGPRNGYSSPFFWERNYNTPGGNTQTVVEDDWEMPLSCTFGRVSAPLQVNCDAFARWTEGASKVSAEVTWMGITKVTKQDGSIVSNYRICSGSGTDLRIPQ